MAAEVNVLDSSAILALLQGEPGSDAVLPLLANASICSVNVAEVLRVLRTAGLSQADANRAFRRLQLSCVPFSEQHAELAAEIGARHPSLSLGDCACLALGRALNARQVVTADRAWTRLATDVRVLSIR